VERITELLCEYSDLFPTTFSKMKWVEKELGEMKIPLRQDSRPIRHISYRLNPVYKHKVKENIDKMLEAGILKPIEESEWIIPMVVQEKKEGGISIFEYLRNMNDSCLDDPFPTPFTDEVLENVGGQATCSFTDGFFRVSPDQNNTRG
jgi:hypothetical protein